MEKTICFNGGFWKWPDIILRIRIQYLTTENCFYCFELEPHKTKLASVVLRCKELGVQFQLRCFLCHNIEVAPPVIGRSNVEMVFAVLATINLFWEVLRVLFFTVRL